MAELLELRDVVAGYGASVVLDDASLAVAEGECVALLGRNGVGKSTLLATILGLTRLHRGEVRWQGRQIQHEPAHLRARAGLGWVPQARRVWTSLTVMEHLAAVARPGPWTPDRAMDLFPSLQARALHRGGQLSGGEQQMLAIARALVTNPRLLLLDEPMEGLAPRVAQELAAVLRQLSTEGSMAILLVEQHAGLALALAQRGVVMERGRIVRTGASAELLADRAGIERLLAL